MLEWKKRNNEWSKKKKIIGWLKDESKKSTGSAVSECMMKGRRIKFEIED